eukprot:scaffold224688_cov37-Tisochrysis_lutea.AAC.1
MTAIRAICATGVPGYSRRLEPRPLPLPPVASAHFRFSPFARSLSKANGPFLTTLHRGLIIKQLS